MGPLRTFAQVSNFSPHVEPMEKSILLAGMKFKCNNIDIFANVLPRKRVITPRFIWCIWKEMQIKILTIRSKDFILEEKKNKTLDN